MAFLLAGDIGRQTTLKLIDSAGKIRPYEKRYRSADYKDLAPIVRKFLTDENVPQQLRHPERSCFALPGPIDDSEALKNNLIKKFGWHQWDSQNLKRELNNTPIQLINDFEAVGYGVAALNKSDYYELQSGNTERVNPKGKDRIAIIGAGSGLGEAFVIMEDNKPREVCASEGGHADLAASSPLEFKLWEFLQKAEDLLHIDMEQVLSGKGIVRIYRFLREDKNNKHQESPYISRVVKTWEQSEGKLLEPAAEIAKAALFKSDPLCELTMQIFMRFYGAEAGNLALKLLPYGGMYITGSIAPRVLPLFDDNSISGLSFREGFNRKGNSSSVLEKIPVRVVLNPQVGLVGTEYYVENKMS